jgi:hypothetical protein
MSWVQSLYIRGAQAVHSAQCAIMCAAVPCTRARDRTARHVAGEGKAASAIGGEGERILSEREKDDLPPTVWWGVQVRHN